MIAAHGAQKRARYFRGGMQEKAVTPVFKRLAMDSDGEQNSPPEEYRSQRRNTDFSQADNDLKRFLSEREENKDGSSENVHTFFR